MARITVEKCINHNRFELVLLAARRAHDIAMGAPLTVTRDNDKNSVVALREIEEGAVSIPLLREGIAKTFLQHMDLEEDHEALDTLTEESGWLHGTETGDLKEEIKEDVLSITDDLESEAL